MQSFLIDAGPILVRAGDNEVLLDDPVSFVDGALAAEEDIQLDVREGMVHGFHGGVGLLNASERSLRQIGKFLSSRFTESPQER